jgi:hypothetical protein
MLLYPRHEIFGRAHKTVVFEETLDPKANPPENKIQLAALIYWMVPPVLDFFAIRPRTGRKLCELVGRWLSFLLWRPQWQGERRRIFTPRRLT